MKLIFGARAVVLFAARASLLLFSLAGGQSAHASDWGPSPGVRIATVTTYASPLSARHDLPQSDEIWLLAQSAPTAAGGQTDREAIIAAFDSSASETVEEDVAKAYGLELVARLTKDSLGKRIVHFRIPDGRHVTDVIALLHADRRVSTAQTNFRYQLLEQPPTEISSFEQDPQVRASQKTGPASVRTQGRGRTALKTPALRRAGSLVVGSYTSLRWPTADEPFVNVGMTNR
jgi:hypothetical protein